MILIIFSMQGWHNLNEHIRRVFIVVDVTEQNPLLHDVIHRMEKSS